MKSNPTLTRRTALRLALLLSPATQARAACAPPPTTTPIDLSHGPCIVTLLLDGSPARMVLDTGAERTILTGAAVARRRLKLDEWVGTALRGAGGTIDEHQNAIVRTLELGDTHLFQRTPGAPFSLPVTALDLGGVDGLLGGDVLRHHTLDLDAPNRRVALLPPDACGQTGLPITLLRRSLPLAAVTLDGQRLTALIDTGASVSLLNRRGLRRLGLDPARLATDPAVTSQAIGGAFTARSHRFTDLRLGPLRLETPSLLTLDTPEPAFHLVLGLDILARQRLRLSYATARLLLGD